MSEQEQPDQLVVSLIQNNQILATTNDKLRGKNADQQQELIALNTVNLERSLEIRALSREHNLLQESHSTLHALHNETAQNHAVYVENAMKIDAAQRAKISELKADLEVAQAARPVASLDVIIGMLFTFAGQALIARAVETSIEKVLYVTRNNAQDMLVDVAEYLRQSRGVAPAAETAIKKFMTAACISKDYLESTHLEHDVERVLESDEFLDFMCSCVDTAMVALLPSVKRNKDVGSDDKAIRRLFNLLRAHREKGGNMSVFQFTSDVPSEHLRTIFKDLIDELISDIRI